MAYLARRDIIYDGSTFHLTWQCHNGLWFLEEEDAKQLYYDLLLKYKDRYGVSIHSYCFMSNHPHLTGNAETIDGLSRLMQTVNSQFAKKINKLLNRRGQVVMDRYKSPVIQSDEVLLCVMTYGDLNPQRVRMIHHPREYRWSSYRYYAYGEADPLITPATSYFTLGNMPEERQAAYREMVDAIIQEDKMKKKPYSRVAYIGDPEWVAARYQEIRELQRMKRRAYQLRQQRTRYRHTVP